MSSPSPPLLFRNVEVEGTVVDVRVDRGIVERVETAVPSDGASIVDGSGGALIPGLHDHHLHLSAMSSARTSVDCSGGLDALTRSSGTWVRGVGAVESVDRRTLDRLVPDRPVRVQHRSGALWMLNSRALAEVAAALDDSPDVERDADGEPTGRLWRFDSRLRAALGTAYADLHDVGYDLAAYGITSVTDATPDPVDPRSIATIPQRVTCLGQRKLLLHDHALPAFDELARSISERHSKDQPVAVHCVTRESLILTLSVLEEVGSIKGDRIEHAAIVPPGVAAWMSRLGLIAVTQPALLTTRGQDYRAQVAVADHEYLYPFASLLAAGVPTFASSDAPFGPLDPWAVLRAARDRRDRTGHVIARHEQVSAATALSGYLTTAAGVLRRVAPGAPADLVLLHAPLGIALREPHADLVRGTWIGGHLVGLRSGSQSSPQHP